jgi:hypothetical protein
VVVGAAFVDVVVVAGAVVIVVVVDTHPPIEEYSVYAKRSSSGVLKNPSNVHSKISGLICQIHHSLAVDPLQSHCHTNVLYLESYP